MLNARGLEEAIKLIGYPKGHYVWKDSYVYLMDLNGKMLAHPMQFELTRNEHVLLEIDAAGKAIFGHFVNIAREHGEGWVDYMWPKPGIELISQYKNDSLFFFTIIDNSVCCALYTELHHVIYI